MNARIDISPTVQPGFNSIYIFYINQIKLFANDNETNPIFFTLTHIYQQNKEYK